MTVADALCLPAFLEAGAQVAAGGDHLDRPVRWVHVAEVADIARLLKGGELLLTTGIGIDGAEEAQRRYVRELAQGGAAGLVLELGRRFLEPPGAMLAEAQERGLPLVVLHRETRYVEITEQVHRAIISHQYELLRRAEEIGRAFNDLALGGADLAAILGHLAGIVRNPVVLDDVAHQVVEFAVHITPADEVLRSWERHSRTGHPEPEPGAVGRAEWSGIKCS
ncbi:MAG: PucR family transcriptional regulator ligand-binding domain-containing protein, partial [Candidatus Dormibacteraceae bacterium]